MVQLIEMGRQSVPILESMLCRGAWKRSWPIGGTLMTTSPSTSLHWVSANSNVITRNAVADDCLIRCDLIGLQLQPYSYLEKCTENVVTCPRSVGFQIFQAPSLS